MALKFCSPCDVWEAVTAGHVQRSPSLLVPLVDICSMVHQQLHTLQVPGQHSLVNGSHTCVYTDREKESAQCRKKKKAFLVGCVGKASLSVLTREVDGVQGDPLGLDETPNPLQLSLAHVILEENVVGEAHAADRLGVFAADCDATVLGVNLESHCLRDRALIVLHSDPCWIFPGVLGELKKKEGCNELLLKIRAGFSPEMQCLSVGSPRCPVSSSGFVSSEGRTSPLGLFILSDGAILGRDSNVWKMSSPSSHGPLTCLTSPDMTANNLSLLTPTHAQVSPPPPTHTHEGMGFLVNTMQDVSSVRGLLTTSGA